MASKSSPLISASCYRIKYLKKFIKEKVNSVAFQSFEMSCARDIVCHKGSTWEGLGGSPLSA